MKEKFVIGVAGGSGSGKTTFSKRILEAFSEKAVLISCDNYYYPHDDMSMDERNMLNYDAPEAIDFDLMVEHVNMLRNGEKIKCPIYDFSKHTRSKDVLELEAKPVIIIDGILILSNQKLRDIMDLKIYIDSDADERILRRAKRDIYERGRTFESVMKQYLTFVKPMHNKYVEPSKKYADIIVNGGKNEGAFDIVKSKINTLLDIKGVENE